MSRSFNRPVPGSTAYKIETRRQLPTRKPGEHAKRVWFTGDLSSDDRMWTTDMDKGRPYTTKSDVERDAKRLLEFWGYGVRVVMVSIRG
jgi:hypothetical protein